MKKFLFFTMLMTIYTLAQVDVIHAQDPGDRAQKFKGTWWSGVHPNLLDEKMLSLRTLDGFGVGFTSGASQSALHYAPSPRFRGLPGGDAVFPPNNDTDVLNQMKKVTEAGFMVQAYTNSENFVGNNGEQFVEFAESWKNWCDTDPEAQAFINSKSYHTKAGFPDRKYMFCYAEFILKELSIEYGQYISLWQFDSAKEMESQGDNATSGNVDDQRIFEAYANAARAGNDEIAVSFNNGRSNLNYNSYPFAAATRFDDFTFGHAFGGNGNHAEKVNGNQFNLNYQHVTRMTETDGFVHEGGNWDWDDKIVGNFNSKLSTTAWSFGPNQAWEQDDFNEWNAEALSAGGMMTWSGSYNRGVSGYYDWVYDMLKATDDYLYERGISINGEITPPPPPPTTDFTTIPALIQAENFSNQSGTQNETTSDTGGGENVGYIDTGDFLEYNVSVPNSGSYSVAFRLASRTSGANFDIYQGNSKIGEISSDATGNFQNWESFSTTVNLDNGDQTIRLLATDGGWNINWIEFSSANVEPESDYTSIPAKIEAEDFNNNSGTENEATFDTGGGENVGYIGIGDFLEYEVSVPDSGEYTIDFRVASLKNGANFDIYQGNSKVGEISSGATNGWQNWITVSATVSLDEGDQTIRLLATGTAWNINWLEFKEGDVNNVPTNCEIPWDNEDIIISDKRIYTSLGVIDISCQDSVCLSLTAVGLGNMENADYLDVTYKVDGGSEQTLLSITDSFNLRDVNSCGISGNTLEIFVSSATSYFNESYILTNVQVISDGDNATTLANIAGNTQTLDATIEREEMVIYPNPVIDEMTINGMEDTILYLYDMNGRMVLRESISDESETLNLNALTPGLYFVKVDTGTDIVTRKIIIQ